MHVADEALIFSRADLSASTDDESEFQLQPERCVQIVDTLLPPKQFAMSVLVVGAKIVLHAAPGVRSRRALKRRLCRLQIEEVSEAVRWSVYLTANRVGKIVLWSVGRR